MKEEKIKIDDPSKVWITFDQDSFFYLGILTKKSEMLGLGLVIKDKLAIERVKDFFKQHKEKFKKEE